MPDLARMIEVRVTLLNYFLWSVLTSFKVEKKCSRKALEIGKIRRYSTMLTMLGNLCLPFGVFIEATWRQKSQTSVTAGRSKSSKLRHSSTIFLKSHDAALYPLRIFCKILIAPISKVFLGSRNSHNVNSSSLNENRCLICFTASTYNLRAHS